MKIKFLGTGDAFCVKNFNANAFIIHNEKKLLFDAGSDVRFSLYENDLSYQDIDAIYLTHFHSDHIGGLEFIAIKSFFDKNRPKIKLFLHTSFVDQLWNNSLKAGLSFIGGGHLTLYDFFDVMPVTTSFVWENLLFDMVPTIHLTDSIAHFPVFGLMVSTGNTHIYFTGDTRFAPNLLMKSYQAADIIFHDVEILKTKSFLHPNFQDLINLDSSIKKKIFFWHYHDNVVENFNEWQNAAIENGFLGFVEKGSQMSFK